MTKLLEKRCEEINGSVKKANGNQQKLNKRMKKMKLTVMKNPKLTDELRLLFDSNKTRLKAHIAQNESMLIQIKEQVVIQSRPIIVTKKTSKKP